MAGINCASCGANHSCTCQMALASNGAWVCRGCKEIYEQKTHQSTSVNTPVNFQNLSSGDVEKPEIKQIVFNNFSS